MPKQTIEIDVPDGMEFVALRQYGGIGDGKQFSQTCSLIFKKKEPEFIEVREFLCCDNDGKYSHNSITRGIHTEESAQRMTAFFRWLGDWRKVEI